MFVFLDTCFSGKSLAVSRGVSGIVIYEEDVEETLLKSAKPIMSATKGNRFANNDPDKLKHGLFTYCLLKGLNGEGDLNDDGAIRLEELFRYVHGEVTRRQKASGMKPQEPQLFNPSGNDAVLMRRR